MQLEIEKKRIYAILQEMQMIQKISKNKLFVLGRINRSDKTVLSCSDIYPIRKDVEMKENTFQLSKEAYQKRIQSTQVALERHSKALNSINLSVQYDKEIDMDKYSVGVSIPLSFTSRRSEQERAAALHKNSALGFQYDQSMTVKNSMLSELKSTLKSKAMMITSLKKNTI